MNSPPSIEGDRYLGGIVMWRLRIMLVSLLGLSLVVGFAVPVGADPPAEESVVPADAILAAVIEASTCDPSVNPTQQQFGLTGASRVIVTCEPADGSIQPQFQVGLGWYIYVYLNRGDWLYLAGLGYAAAAAALCWWLTPTLVGAVACAVAAYIIGHYVISRSAPPRGYCAEFKFTYVGTFAGYKLVKRSC